MKDKDKIEDITMEEALFKAYDIISGALNCSRECVEENVASRDQLIKDLTTGLENGYSLRSQIKILEVLDFHRKTLK